MIDSGQIRAARALLNLHQMQLAEIAGVSPATVKRIETASEIRGAAESLWKIQVALEKCGIEFIPGDQEKGPGVRLHKPKATNISPNRKGKDLVSKARRKRSL
jgi:transcriptional regulator with XRE-family HTH domain